VQNTIWQVQKPNDFFCAKRALHFRIFNRHLIGGLHAKAENHYFCIRKAAKARKALPHAFNG